MIVKPEGHEPVYGLLQQKQRRQQGRQRKKGKKGRQQAAQQSQAGLQQATEVPRSLAAWLATLDPAAD